MWSRGFSACLLSAASRFKGDCGRSYVDIVYWEREDIITLWRLERDFAEYCGGFTLSYVGECWAYSIMIINSFPILSFLFFYFRSSTFAFFALQVLCTIGKLKEIPQDFPLETEEITISNQDIRTIQPSSKHLYFLKIIPV